MLHPAISRPLGTDARQGDAPVREVVAAVWPPEPALAGSRVAAAAEAVLREAVAPARAAAE